LTEDSPRKISWDHRANQLYALTEQTFYRLDPEAQTADSIHQTEKEIAQEFYIEDNDIYYIEKLEQANVLYKYNLSFQTTKKVLDLNISKDYKFIKSNNNYLTIIDTSIEKLYLIKKIINNLDYNLINLEPVKEFNASNAVWDQSETQLILYNDFEIFTYDTNTNEEKLINRYGQKILKAQWYPKNNYLLVLFDESLKIIDLHIENGLRNVTEILKFEKLNDFHLDEDAEKIYFSGQNQEQKGIFKIIIR